MADLLDSLMGRLEGRSTIVQIAGELGVEPGQANPAVTASAPPILARPARNAQKLGGASALVTALEKDHDRSFRCHLPFKCRGLVIAVCFLAAVAILGRFQTSRAQGPGAELEAFAREIVALAIEGNFAGIVDRAVTRPVTCPTDEGLRGNICEGQPAGTVVEGYLFGPLSGAGDFFGRDAFEALIRARVEELGAANLRLFTIAQGAHLTGRVCVSCATAAVSTVAEADLSDGVALLMLFELESVNGSPRVVGFLAGVVDDLARPAIEGGTYAHMQFVRLDGAPVPPAAGTGVGYISDDGTPLFAWFAFALLLTTVIGFRGILGSLFPRK